MLRLTCRVLAALAIAGVAVGAKAAAGVAEAQTSGPSYTVLTVNTVGQASGGRFADGDGGSLQAIGSDVPVSSDGNYLVTTGGPNGVVWRDRTTGAQIPLGFFPDGSSPQHPVGVEYFKHWSPPLADAVDCQIRFDWNRAYRWHALAGPIETQERWHNRLVDDLPDNGCGELVERSAIVGSSAAGLLYKTECRIIADDLNNRYDMYLWDPADGSFELVSRYPGGCARRLCVLRAQRDQ